jgi:hypothetical protein
MAKKSIETKPNPEILVQQVGSDLQVKGWDKDEVLVKSSSDNDLTLEEQDGVVTASCPNDCVMYVPQGASVKVESIGSSARFRSVMGKITLGTVGTDLGLRDVGPVKVEVVGSDLLAKRVNGDISVKTVGSSATVGDVGGMEFGGVGNQLIAKRVRGDLKITNRVGGNAVIRDVDGQVTVKNIGGSLHLRDVSGGITAEASGNATVEFSPVSWQAYDIKAGGELRCHMVEEANATFEITSGAQTIRVKTPDISEVIKEGNYTLTQGEGAASVKLTAGGSVSVTSQSTTGEELGDFDIDFGDEISSMAEEIAEQTTRQIEAQLEMLESNLNVHLSGLATSLSMAGLSEERAKELEERLEMARERAAMRAEETAQRVQERVERKLAAAQRKAERKARASAVRRERRAREHHGMSYISTPPPPPTKVDPVSEGERLMILQMLQDKKISVEQAEKLLSALEGK